LIERSVRLLVDDSFDVVRTKSYQSQLMLFMASRIQDHRIMFKDGGHGGKTFVEIQGFDFQPSIRQLDIIKDDRQL